MTSGGPELGGDVHRLSCTGGVWLPTFDTELCDGTYYIGDIGAGPIYSTDETHESSEYWNDGNSNYSNPGITSTTDGSGNTISLVAVDSDDTTPGVQPHDAAAYCDSLSAHGRSDWYLPAEEELQVFWSGGNPIANIDTSGAGIYWSTTESFSVSARYVRMSDGYTANRAKGNSGKVRCVRVNN